MFSPATRFELRTLENCRNFRYTSHKTTNIAKQSVRIFLYLLYNFRLYRVTRDKVEPSVSVFFCHKQCAKECKHAEIDHLNIVFHQQSTH